MLGYHMYTLAVCQLALWECAHQLITPTEHFREPQAKQVYQFQTEKRIEQPRHLIGRRDVSICVLDAG